MNGRGKSEGVTAAKGFDPVKRAEEVAKIVSREDQRKYYRFRSARFYGGIATADCVGCCLHCLFCWSWSQVVKPGRFGQFYDPQDVAGRLETILRKKRFRRVRVSGNEPTVAWDHLVKVIELLRKDVFFILETNGILIGHDDGYAKDLARFDNLYVRVSLKGCTEEEFSYLTGAVPEGFALQLQALENLSRAGVRAHPAAMISFSPPENIRALRKRLKEIAPEYGDPEIEELALYGDVEKRLRRAGIGYRGAYDPHNIPPEQV
jgi:uncharacterized Fe-S cluster-containing radical SAM superfamily protein